MADLLRELFKPPDIYGVLGLVFLFLGVFSMWTGKAPSRGGMVYRAKEPKTFWFIIVVDYLAAVGFIGKFYADSP